MSDYLTLSDGHGTEMRSASRRGTDGGGLLTPVRRRAHVTSQKSATRIGVDEMLYKTLVAAFVVSSGDALRIDGVNTRRAAIASAASALSLVPLAAFAELKQAGDAIYR